MNGSMAMDIKKLRMTVDISMVILLPVLMGYSLVGETAHEIIGVVMGVLFAVHITLNRKWFAALFRGKYNLRGIITTILNIMLILCVITSMVSGIMISKHLFAFLKLSSGTSLMRALHLLAGYWGFVLMSIHAGTHTGAMLTKTEKLGTGARTTIYALLLCVAAYGVYAFIKRSIYQYMLLISSFVFFDTSEPYIRFYIDYLTIMIMFMTVGYSIIRICTPLSCRRSRSNTTE